MRLGGLDGIFKTSEVSGACRQKDEARALEFYGLAYLVWFFRTHSLVVWVSRGRSIPTTRRVSSGSSERIRSLIALLGDDTSRIGRHHHFRCPKQSFFATSSNVLRSCVAHPPKQRYRNITGFVVKVDLPNLHFSCRMHLNEERPKPPFHQPKKNRNKEKENKRGTKNGWKYVWRTGQWAALDP